MENLSIGSQVEVQVHLAIRLRSWRMRVILQKVQFPAQEARLQNNAQGSLRVILRRQRTITRQRAIAALA